MKIITFFLLSISSSLSGSDFYYISADSALVNIFNTETLNSVTINEKDLGGALAIRGNVVACFSQDIDNLSWSLVIKRERNNKWITLKTVNLPDGGSPILMMNGLREFYVNKISNKYISVFWGTDGNTMGVYYYDGLELVYTSVPSLSDKSLLNSVVIGNIGDSFVLFNRDNGEIKIMSEGNVSSVKWGALEGNFEESTYINFFMMGEYFLDEDSSAYMIRKRDKVKSLASILVSNNGVCELISNKVTDFKELSGLFDVPIEEINPERLGNIK